MSGQNPLAHLIYPLLASIAGAITALSFRAFNNMKRGEIAMALFVGASFAFFMGPWITSLVFGNGPIDLKLQGALYYLLASGSNIFIPLAVRKASQFFETKDQQP